MVARGSRQNRLHKTANSIVVFHAPANVDGEALIAARRVPGGNRVCLPWRIDPAEAAISEWDSRYWRLVRRELDALEAVGQQLLVTRQSFKSRPRTSGTQVHKVIKIQIDTEPRGKGRAVIQKAGGQCHS
jgi:hypothetical protein